MKDKAMKIVYAPSFTGFMDDLHTNVVCGFEIGVLESLCEIVGDKGEVLYFLHTQTPKTYHTTILEAFKGCPISLIQQIQKGGNTDVLVSDFSNRIFEYSLSFAKPSIVFLSGIIGISFNQDKFYKLLQDCAYFAFSLKDLKDICKTLDFKTKTREIESFFTKGFFMNIQAQINTFVFQTTSKIQSHLSNEKKNILVIAYYPTYRNHFENLIPKLKRDYNVITIVDRILNDEFESNANANVLFPWRVIESGGIYYLNADIPNIDLILTADEVGYEGGRIDREFLGKSAKRVYFPHSLIESTGNPLVFDYILSPTSITTQAYKKHKKGAKILNAGYPKFDKSLQEYSQISLNTIIYAPLLRYVDESNNVYVNLFAGYENNLVEWLLENTHYQISYRTHPLNVYANHGYYQLIKENWRNEERVSFPFFYKPHKSDSNLAKYIPYVCEGGGYVRRLKELKRQIETCDFSKMRLKIENFREEIVFNVGKSENYILESIEDILKGKI